MKACHASDNPMLNPLRNIFIFSEITFRRICPSLFSWMAPKSVWVFKAVHAMIVSLISFFPEGSEKHSRKPQRWCSRQEWHGSRWGWCLCRNRWCLRSCREMESMIQIGHNLKGQFTTAATFRNRGSDCMFILSVSGWVSYLHVRLTTSITPLYVLCWSCRRARTTWYGYVVATANILDKAAIVMYSHALCLNRRREQSKGGENDDSLL